MTRLTAMQAKVYSCLKGHWRHVNAQPSLHEVARDLGIDYVTLRQHLKALSSKGYLHFESRGSGKPPIVKLRGPVMGVPLIGYIPAGPLSEALEHPEGFIQMNTKASVFALRVQGDSMAERIQSGDIVFLDKALEPISGQICAVRIDGSDVTLKYLDWRGRKPSTYTLRAHNLAYDALKVPASELIIEGVYFGLLRGDIADAFIEKGPETM